MALHNDVTEEQLESLAAVRADGPVVLSLYLDLDPAEFATAAARDSQIDSLLDRAHREIEHGERAHGELMALRAARDRARQMLADDRSWAEGSRAIALFISPPLQLERLLRVAQPLASAVVIDDAPFMAPLVEAGPAGRVCVALVDERFTRILRGAVHALSEVVSFGDQVHGRHDQGGFSQARYQRSIREDAESHLRRTARLLADLRRVAPYERLLIACTQPLWSRMVEKLHADVRRTLHEQRLALDVADVSIAEVEAAVAPVLEAEHRRRLGELLADLHERLGRRERVASGLDAVLAALVERRVEALVYEAALSAPGVLCPRCGWLGREARNGCPVDGARLEARERILEDALAAAVGQSAELLPVDDGVQLEPFQGIAATLRF